MLPHCVSGLFLKRYSAYKNKISKVIFKFPTLKFTPNNNNVVDNTALNKITEHVKWP